MQCKEKNIYEIMLSTADNMQEYFPNLIIFPDPLKGEKYVIKHRKIFSHLPNDVNIAVSIQLRHSERSVLK